MVTLYIQQIISWSLRCKQCNPDVVRAQVSLAWSVALLTYELLTLSLEVMENEQEVMTDRSLLNLPPVTRHLVIVASLQPPPPRISNLLRHHCISSGSNWKTHYKKMVLGGGRFKNTYELLNLGALKLSPVNKIHIFQCMGKIFGLECHSVPLKFHAKYLTHTLEDNIL